MSENPPKQLKKLINTALDRVGDGEIISISQTATRQNGHFNCEHITVVIVFSTAPDTQQPSA